MARICDITIKQQAGYNYISIRKTINFMAEFTHFTFESFHKIQQFLTSISVLVSDGPIICFHNMDLEHLDIEVGFPIAQDIAVKEDLQFNKIPAQKVVVTIDLGAYEKQDSTLEALISFIQTHDYKITGPIYYQYLNDINRPAEQYLTKMMIPIE